MFRKTLQRMADGVRRWMWGRNGVDTFNLFLLFLAVGLSLVGNMVTSRYDDYNMWSVGAKADYYPISGNRDLRTYASLSYLPNKSYLGLIIGVMYNLRIRVF